MMIALNDPFPLCSNYPVKNPKIIIFSKKKIATRNKIAGRPSYLAAFFSETNKKTLRG